MDTKTLHREPSWPDAEREAAGSSPDGQSGATDDAIAVADDLSVSQIRGSLGISRRDFSRLSGYSERAIAGWEKGERPSGPSRQRLHEVRELQRALGEVMEAGQIGPWLLRPNPAFGGLKPLEVIERGEIHRIWRMVFYLQSGVPS